MPQFTVYENINDLSQKIYPYLLDVQNDLLEGLNTRVVIPMCLPSTIGKKAINNLSPQLEIQGNIYTLLTPQLAGIPISELGPAVCNLSESRFEIIKALDFLFTGF
ncbi:MAG: CcdB family protein [SAR324 cluster bacterium]|nr:CcdB family protein [SAR324 cluster bacterium]